MQRRFGCIRSIGSWHGDVRHRVKSRGVCSASAPAAGNRPKSVGYACLPRKTTSGPARHTSSDGHDFLFLGRQQLVDFGNRSVGGFLNVVVQALLIVLGNLVTLLKLLDDIETVTTDMTHGDLGSLGIFMRYLHELLAALLVKLRNAQPQHLTFGGRT